MFIFLLRTLWRLIVLAVGIGLIILIIELFPYAQAQLPIAVVLLIIWCLAAYVFIPALIRLHRVFIKPNHIPHYAGTGDGWPSDPVMLAVIAKDRRQLELAMNQSGWITADPLTIKNGFMEVISILFNTSYPAAPLSNLYLFNRAHDIGFEIPTNAAGSARTRHHVRFWRLEEPAASDKNVTHYDFWVKKLRHLLKTEREIWIGAATEETHPIDIQWHTGQLTHGGSHDAARERDYIIKTLEDTNLVRSVHTTKPGKEVKFRGQQFQTHYVTDGSLKVIELKRTLR